MQAVYLTIIFHCIGKSEAYKSFESTLRLSTELNAVTEQQQQQQHHADLSLLGCAILCSTRYQTCNYMTYNSENRSCGIPFRSYSDVLVLFDRDIPRIPAFFDELFMTDAWVLLFIASSGDSSSSPGSIYDGWIGAPSAKEPPPGGSKYRCNCIWKSPIVTQWNSLGIKKVKLSLYAGGHEVAFLQFDGTGSDTINWFSKSRLLSSTWTDLTPHSPTNFFSIVGDSTSAIIRRRFFVNSNYGGCPNDQLWMAVQDPKPQLGSCSYDRRTDTPLIAYSPYETKTGISNLQYAEQMVIYARL
ncbi:uncharacterized protein LOC141910503 [Tubulanus polymorphus]|uniref:uncharacterized protein LOC141910503 n=1 Tax=Tubulanus polymorphus TaxID=672921 RepID=UPI003DA6B4E7